MLNKIKLIVGGLCAVFLVACAQEEPASAPESDPQAAETMEMDYMSPAGSEDAVEAMDEAMDEPMDAMDDAMDEPMDDAMDEAEQGESEMDEEAAEPMEEAAEADATE